MTYLGSNENRMRIRTIYEQIEIMANAAFEEGVNQGLRMKKPTKSEFHETHRQPVTYGEDGVLVLSGELSEEVARKRFVEYAGAFQELFPEDIAVERSSIGLILNDDGDTDYYLFTDRQGYYEAWVWESYKDLEIKL